MKLQLKRSTKDSVASATQDRPILYIIDGEELAPQYENIDHLDQDEIATISVFKKPAAKEKYGEKAEKRTIVEVWTKKNAVKEKKDKKEKKHEKEKKIDSSTSDVPTKIHNRPSSQGDAATADKQPLYVVDDIVLSSSRKDMDHLDPNEIESINVLKGQSAMLKYGSKGGKRRD